MFFVPTSFLDLHLFSGEFSDGTQACWTTSQLLWGHRFFSFSYQKQPWTSLLLTKVNWYNAWFPLLHHGADAQLWTDDFPQNTFADTVIPRKEILINNHSFYIYNIIINFKIIYFKPVYYSVVRPSLSNIKINHRWPWQSKQAQRVFCTGRSLQLFSPAGNKKLPAAAHQPAGKYTYFSSSLWLFHIQYGRKFTSDHDIMWKTFIGRSLAM